MLSWSTDSLIADGRSQGEIREGVTTQIFGEGSSMGPLTPEMKQRAIEQMGDIKYDITWTTLSEYSDDAGAARRVAERRVVHRRDDGARARDRARGRKADAGAARTRCARSSASEMEAGALGIGSSLIYAPAFYASTEELIELCKVAAQYRGKYISHMRSEGNQLLEAVDELIRDQPRGAHPGGDLSPEGRRPGELAEDGSGDREDRGGPRRRA